MATHTDNSSQKKYVYSSVNSHLDSEKCVQECTDSGPIIGTRHVQIALYFLLGFVAFSFRVALSVGIVAMMDPSVSSNPEIVTYPNWTKKNVILSAFFWGYIFPQLLAAWVAKKYGPKWILVGSVFVQSILSILLPVTAATFGEKGMMVSRALEGLFQGCILPSAIHLLSQWVPPQERSRFGSVIFTSGKLGTLFSIFTTGMISASPYGWPWAFRGLGCLGLLWCTLMAIFGYNSPRDHPRITQAEKLYIETSLGFDNKHHETPWKAIFTSAPVWALYLAQTGQTYAFWTQLTQMPSYLNYVMKFDMKNNGLWSSMPYLAMFILSYVFGFISDKLINKRVISRTIGRKIFNSIGFLVPAGALMALSYTKSDQSSQAVAMSIIAIGVSSACYSGFAVNHMDLSPNHAGMIMALINSFSQINGAVAPLVAQHLVTNQTDVSQWRAVFMIAAAAYTIPAIIFVIFSSGKVQKWNTNETSDTK